MLSNFKITWEEFIVEQNQRRYYPIMRVLYFWSHFHDPAGKLFYFSSAAKNRPAIGQFYHPDGDNRRDYGFSLG